MALQPRRMCPRDPMRRACAPLALGAALLVSCGSPLAARGGAREGEPVVERLKRMSLEELMSVQVSSVSKRSEERVRAAAAIAVITSDDIRRSGVTTLADALRLAPGVHVAQIDSNKWAVGIRGFANRFSRSVLVLIDGRSVYTPLFAGTYWEVQDTLLEDVDRIEVIRGPGGTLWGANAFNGVINIITKSSRDTHGNLLSGGIGTEEEAFAAYRHGGATAGGLHHRFYVKGFERDSGFRDDGIELDDWAMGQAGFRLDWSADDDDSFTVQGDVYDGHAGQRWDIITFAPPFVDAPLEDAQLSGANVLMRWTRALEGGGQTTLQSYYDWTDRDEPTFREKRGTFDVEFQHTLRPRGAHRLVWGANFRTSSDDIESLDFLGVDPTSRSVPLYSAFIQDEVSFRDDTMRFIFGSKFEQNEFSGFEAQPNVRFIWTPDTERETAVWTAISRAVRTPSRVEEDLFFTQPPDPASGAFPRLIGPGNFVAEEVTAYEAGFRIRASKHLFLDFAAFYNDFDELLGFEPGSPFLELSPPPPHFVAPLLFTNSLHGHSQGFELAATLDVADNWQLEASWSHLDIELELDPGATDTTLIQAEGQAPEDQVMVRSHFDVGEEWEIDAIMRWVDDLPADAVEDYLTADLRLAWSPHPGLEVAIVAQDLAAPDHREFAGSSIGSTRGGSRVRRGVYGKVTWRF